MFILQNYKTYVSFLLEKKLHTSIFLYQFFDSLNITILGNVHDKSCSSEQFIISKSVHATLC